MQRSDTYPGIYRGMVVNTDDPLGKNRVTLLVPQVSGEEVTGWAWPANALLKKLVIPTSLELSYGNFSRAADLSLTSTSTVYVVPFDTVEDTGGGIYRDSTNTSRIYVPKDGDYQIIFSPQFSNTNSSSAQADVWLRKNGVDIARTNSRVTLQGLPNEVIATIPFIIDLKAGDYIEIACSTDHSTVSLKSYTGLTTPVRPDIPAVIMTVSLLDNPAPDYQVDWDRPSAGDTCWVMFEGGDPNFPIWIGKDNDN